ncbi:MAG: tetratricopeptide repeat protein [Candidatus Edwardsbacteria bacterium]|nr:tetratricopeptide repeat protein [Candidatus Edwardsbacteria bacterium]
MPTSRPSPVPLKRWWVDVPPAGRYPAQLVRAKIDVLFRMGRWDQAERESRNGAEICGTAGHRAERGRFLNLLGNILSYRGLRVEALEVMRQAYDILSEPPGRPEMVSVCYNLGFACEHTGDLDAALEHYRRGQALADRLGERRSVARADGNIGIIHAMRGDLATAIVHFERLLSASEADGDIEGIALAHGNLGLALLYSGDPDAADAHLRNKLDISRRLGDRLGVCQALGSRGDLRLARGDFAGALSDYREAREHARAMNNLNMQVVADEKTGEVLTAMGECAPACQVLAGAIAQVERDGSRLCLPSLWYKVGDACRALGNPAGAAAAYRSAIAIGTECGQETFYLGAYRGLAELALARGDVDDARRQNGTLLSLARKHGIPDCEFDGRVLEQRIAALDGDAAAAVAGLSSLLASTANEQQRAEILYRLWQISGASSARARALEVCRIAATQQPTAVNAARVAELSAG